MAKIDPKKIFNGNCQFMLGVNSYEQLPNHHFTEFAFIGASNVGKSSLINSLLAKKIAIVSAMQGRTKELNFFKVQGFKDGFCIVDMPGYGFARDSLSSIKHWQKLSLDYLLNRQNLKRVFLLIEAQKNFKEHDLELIEFFNAYSIPFQIILTKIDKLNLTQQKLTLEKIKNDLKLFPSARPEIIATSCKKNYGIFEIQNEIIKILESV